MSLSLGNLLVIIAAVLGGLVIILGLIYGYIYFTQIKPRPRRFGEARLDYEAKLSCKIEHGQVTDQQEKPRIKTHPFLIMNYVSRIRNDNVSPNATSSSQQA